MSRRLHIGGEARVEGWEILDALDGPHVDHVGKADDLARFDDGVFAEIYASHVIEHFDYTGELQRALAEWCRVLAPGGKLLASVPDLDTLAGLIVDKRRLDMAQRFLVMRMLFGGHMDPYDYHVVGLNEEFLGNFLAEAGFINVTRVDRFGLFDDSSCLEIGGVPVSLNLVAEKPARTPGGGGGQTPSRNAPCPCGSGKKYKRCHGRER